MVRCLGPGSLIWGIRYEVHERPNLTNRSLATKAPKIAAEWHSTKNGALTPRHVFAGSGKMAWWKCSQGPDHEWQTPIDHRTVGKTGCPFCAGRRLSIINSLATRFPEIAAEWHPTKNGALAPNQLVAGSSKKVWWRCPKGPDHKWVATIVHRTNGTGCPFCAGLRVSVTNSLATQAPDVAVQWNTRKNGTLTADQVSQGSNRKAWWTCSSNPDHEWYARIADRTSGRRSGCPFFAKKRALRSTL